MKRDNCEKSSLEGQNVSEKKSAKDLKKAKKEAAKAVKYQSEEEMV